MADFLGSFNASGSRTTVRFAFTTHAASGAAVAPNSAFENADLKIYKDGSATERSSASGITMTSPFDSVVGLHFVSIDLTDNTDAGFWAAGSHYTVVLSPDETVDSLAVVKVLAYFEIGPPQVNATQLAGQTITAAAGVTFPASVASPTNITAGTITTVTTLTNLPAITAGWLTATGIASDAITAAKIADGAIDAATFAAGAINAAAIAADAITDAKVASDVTIASVTGSVGSIATGGISAASFAAGAIDAAAIAANAIGASELAADAVTEIQSGLATAASIAALNNIAAADVWAVGTRTLTSMAGLTIDTVTTLTNLPAITANWLTAAGTAADFTTEIQSGLATAASLATVAGYIDTEIGTIITHLTDIKGATWASTDSLEAIRDRGDAAWVTATGFATAVALATAQTSLDDIPTNAELAASQAVADDATLAAIAALSIPTAAQNADALLGRNVAGGSSSGRLVKEALYVLRNKVDVVLGNVYETDDVTVAWTFTVTSSAGADPVTVFDPG